jgi:hypothetical protein
VLLTNCIKLYAVYAWCVKCCFYSSVFLFVQQCLMSGAEFRSRREVQGTPVQPWEFCEGLLLCEVRSKYCILSSSSAYVREMFS